MIDDVTITAARARALAARTRLDASVAHAKARLSPRTLAADAVDSATEKAAGAAQSAVAFARERPAVAATGAGVIALLLARRPLLNLLGFRKRDHDATAEETASSPTSNLED